MTIVTCEGMGIPIHFEVMKIKLLCIIMVLIVFITNAASCSDNVQAVYSIPVSPFINCMKDVQATPEDLCRIVFNKDDIFNESEITVNNSAYGIPAEYSEKIFEHINSNRYNTGFYAIDIETQTSFGYNADRNFFSASTIKAGYALYCFKEIAKGNAEFTDLIKYTANHYIGGSGSTQHSIYGTLFTVKVLLYRMLYDSDNIAYYMLIDYFGLDGYNEMIQNLGCTNTITRANRWGQLTAHELGLVWQEIYHFKDSCEEGEILWSYLTGNLYNEIKTAVSGYDTVAHKSGWNDDSCHDAGIVMSDSPYIVVVMSDNKSVHSYIRKIIRYIDDIMIDYNQSSKN